MWIVPQLQFQKLPIPSIPVVVVCSASINVSTEYTLNYIQYFTDFLFSCWLHTGLPWFLAPVSYSYTSLLLGKEPLSLPHLLLNDVIQ